jgi:GT2 family glycosyltransferase
VDIALKQKTPSRLNLVVVDNSPSPKQLAVPDALRDLHSLKVLDPGKNLCYYGAAAHALRYHLASHPLPSWVIVSNPDVRFADDRFLQHLNDLHPGKEPAIVAPSIRSSVSASDQNPYMRRRPSRFRMHFYRWIFSNYPTDIAYQSLSWIKHRVVGVRPKAASQAVETRSPEDIYAPHGSFVAFNRSYFQHGGNLELGTFLFGEEIFVAETARRLGLTVKYEPRLVVEHDEHTSMGSIWNRNTARFRKDASRYLAKSFF